MFTYTRNTHINPDGDEYRVTTGINSQIFKTINGHEVQILEWTTIHFFEDAYYRAETKVDHIMHITVDQSYEIEIDNKERGFNRSWYGIRRSHIDTAQHFSNIDCFANDVRNYVGSIEYQIDKHNALQSDILRELHELWLEQRKLEAFADILAYSYGELYDE